jgi:hypothetical protein
MTILGKTRETITAAGQSIAGAMRVAIVACILSVVALVVALVSLTRSRPGLTADLTRA